MLTFTMRGDASLTRENLADLQHSWRVFSRWLARTRTRERCAHRFRYANAIGARTWVRELGEVGGRLHLHVLLEIPFLCYFCVREAVIRAGFGVVCDIQRVRGAASGYVSKYLAKSASDPRWRRLKGARRCQTTVPDFPRAKGWLFQPPDYETARALQRISQHEAFNGWMIDRMLAYRNMLAEEDAERGEVVWRDDRVTLALTLKQNCVSYLLEEGENIDVYLKAAAGSAGKSPSGP